MAGDSQDRAERLRPTFYSAPEDVCPTVSQISKEAERSESQEPIRTIMNDPRDYPDGWDLKAHARGSTAVFEHYFGMA